MGDSGEEGFPGEIKLRNKSLRIENKPGVPSAAASGGPYGNFAFDGGDVAAIYPKDKKNDKEPRMVNENKDKLKIKIKHCVNWKREHPAIIYEDEMGRKGKCY